MCTLRQGQGAGEEGVEAGGGGAEGRRRGGEEGSGVKGGRNDLIENITSQCRYHFQESNSAEQGAS